MYQKASHPGSCIPTHHVLCLGELRGRSANRIQKVLNFGARIIAGLSRRDRVTPVLEELGWSSVDDLIRKRDIAAMRRMLSVSPAPEILRQQITRRSEVSAPYSSSR